jgi:lysophospholipase
MKPLDIHWDAAATFATTKEFPKPRGAEIGMLNGVDGAPLRTALFYPPASAKAYKGGLVLMTGYSEYIEKYITTAQVFAKQGYVVALPEWRGHGRSFRPSRDKNRLHLDDFDVNCRDLHQRLTRLWEAGFPTDSVALAHSMGGQIAVRAAAQWPTVFRALALSSPMLGIRLPQVQQVLLRLVGVLYRWRGQLDSYVPADPATRNEANPLMNFVTHDQALWDRNEAFLAAYPDMQVNGRSIGWTLAAMRAMRDTARPAFLRRVEMPVFIGSAADEMLVSNDAISHAAAHLPDATHKHYQDAMHELLMELPSIRDAFVADCLAFFAAH